MGAAPLLSGGRGEVSLPVPLRLGKTQDDGVHTSGNPASDHNDSSAAIVVVVLSMWYGAHGPSRKASGNTMSEMTAHERVGCMYQHREAGPGSASGHQDAGRIIDAKGKVCRAKEQEVTLFHQPDKKRFLVNVVNEQEQLPPIPVSNVTVRVRMDDKKAVRAALLPDEKPLPFAAKGEYVEVTVPELNIFHMLMVVYE